LGKPLSWTYNYNGIHHFNDRMNAIWEERFAQDGYLFGTEPVPFLLKHEVTLAIENRTFLRSIT